MARRSPMKRQPTTCGPSPWQQVESPLAWRRRRSSLPNLVHVRQKGSTDCSSPGPSAFWSASDLLLPNDAPLRRRNAKNQFSGLGHMDLPVGLLLSSRPRDKEQPRVSGDRLSIAQSASASLQPLCAQQAE